MGREAQVEAKKPRRSRLSKPADQEAQVEAKRPRRSRLSKRAGSWDVRDARDAEGEPEGCVWAWWWGSRCAAASFCGLASAA
eukprot:COSAG06_NODE_7241_length_2574_cov_2.490101_2_plen_82_part_00